MTEQVPKGEKIESRSSAAMEHSRMRAEETVKGAAQKGSGYIYNQKRLAAVEMDGYACALRESARQLHDQDQNGAAQMAERAADGLDRMAHYLREQEIGDMLNKIGDFAKRQPGIFVGGAMAAGFLLSRLMKGTVSEDVSSHPEEMSYSGGKESEAYTSADMEIPVILQPRETTEHPGGPTP